jgi:hypothetical protein
MFTAQILVASVLTPAWLARYLRGWAANYGSERLAELYPSVDYDKSIARFTTGFRAAHGVIALLGLALLAWLFTLTRRPDWSDDVAQVVVFYFLLQMAPMLITALYAVARYHRVLMQPSQEIKRKATLQRRGLSDFVSPVAVAVAVMSYVLFVPYSIWVDLVVYQNATLSKQCIITLASVSLVCALNAFVVYKYLYGRKNPLLTQDGRVHTMGANIRGAVYGSIVIVWFVTIMSTFTKLDLEDWSPFAMSTFFVICTLLSFWEMTKASRKPNGDGLDSTEVAS